MIKSYSVINNHPLLSRFIIFIMFPVIILICYGVHFLRLSLPENNGNYIVSGISSKIQIIRDSHGVPYISAENDLDVFFATGYVHAQDRLWQLELQRRIADGRMSELFGQESFQQDVWMRTLGLYASARNSWLALDKDAQLSLQAYSDGINAWIKSHKQYPIEFGFYGIEPEEWTVYDSLAWAKVFSLNLSGNFRKEISNYLSINFLAHQKHPASQISKDTSKELAFKESPATTALDMSRIGALQDSLEQKFGIGGNFVGSNAWVISGKLMLDGNALLANDPHLGLTLPSPWYAVVQNGDLLHSSGMTLIGLPLVIFGKNDKISWGGTAMMADVQDIYFEQINPQNPKLYMAGDKWIPFITRTEQIKIKPDFPAMLRESPSPVNIIVRETRNGAVISDSIGILNQPFSLKWTSLQQGDASYGAYYHLNYADDWTSFKESFRHYVAPALNMLYADTKGNIGFLGVGKIPVRVSGDGRLPIAGWSLHENWSGFIPFEKMPNVYNPDKGYIVSANNRNTPDNYPYFISLDWAPESRYQRIAQMLDKFIDNKEKIKIENVIQMQTDVLSLPALKILPLLRKLPIESARQQKAMNYLATWNGEMSIQSEAASIFNVWMKHIKMRLFSNQFDREWENNRQVKYLEASFLDTSLDDLYEMIDGKNNHWCNNAALETKNKCTTILLDSFDAALNELERLSGKDMAKWQWGKLHKINYSHIPFGRSHFLETFFIFQAPSGGTTDTVNVANAQFVKSKGYIQDFGSSFRQIISNNAIVTTHLFINSPGQSGNVISRHFSDMLTSFVNLKYEKLNREINDGLESTLILNPKNKQVPKDVSQ